MDFGEGAIDIPDTYGGFFVKYDNNLLHQWNRIISPVENSAENSANDVRVDNNGNIYVFGSFKESIDFGNGITVSGTYSDPFIVKYDNMGNALWAQAFNCLGSNNAFLNNGFFIDLFNNSLAVAGRFTTGFSISDFELIPEEGTAHIFVASDISPLNDANDILEFEFAEIPTQNQTVVIDNINHTVEVFVPEGTSVSFLTPEIIVSAGATISPESGTQQDFFNPFEYTVTAENSQQQIWIVTVEIATGIEENNVTYSIYPNPSNGIVNLTGLRNLIGFNGVEITDINGKTIFTHKGTCALALQIDLSNKPKGIYFIKIKTENEIYTEKLIVR